MGLITKGMGAIMKKLSTASRNKSSKKVFKEASGGLQHPVITSFKPKKNLKKRREDFEDIVHHVDKHGKTPGSAKIKKDAAIKVSKIHDKYEKKK